MAVSKFCIRCADWYVGDGEHLCQTVDDGRLYHVTVSTCTNCRGEGREVHTIAVRAWNLRSALRIAGEQPLSIWIREDCEDE